MKKIFGLINRLVLMTLAIILVTSVGSSFVFAESIDGSVEDLRHQPLIAHAGGQIYGYKYTNSLEAIENSYNNGFKLIELDFEWTLDDEIVLIHDWTAMAERLLKVQEVFSYEGFRRTEKFMDLTLLNLNDLVVWLEDKNDVHIITDAKSKNIEFMETIATNYEHIMPQIIPQVYTFGEYIRAEELGYENIILTLYNIDYSEDEIIEFARNNTVFAITMPVETGYSELPMRLKQLDVISYVHTVNDLYIFEELSDNGVYGIYTDYFQANKWID